MEERLDQIKTYFDDDVEFFEETEKVLEAYLVRTIGSITPYMKEVLPIFAAFYMVLEFREFPIELRSSSAQESGATSTPESKKSSASQQRIRKISQTRLMDLFKHFNNLKNSNPNNNNDNNSSNHSTTNGGASSSIELVDAIEQMIEFTQKLDPQRQLTERVLQCLEAASKNYRLFTKLSTAIQCYFQQDETSVMERLKGCVWRMFRFLFAIDKTSDLERNAYLVLFVCENALVEAGKKPRQILQADAAIADMPEIGQQINAIIFNGRLDLSLDTARDFNSALTTASKKLGLPDAIFTYFSSAERINQLLDRLVKVNQSLDLEDTEFVEESFPIPDISQIIVTSTPMPKSSRFNSYNPAGGAYYNHRGIDAGGMTKEYQESKERKYAMMSKQNQFIPMKSLSFNDDAAANVHLNSKLCDFDKSGIISSPGFPKLQQQQANQNTNNNNWNPRTPTLAEQQFKVPHLRTPSVLPVGLHTPSGSIMGQSAAAAAAAAGTAAQMLPPTTPYSTALDNFKWINEHSRNGTTEKIDAIMLRISPDYKKNLSDTIVAISQEVFLGNRALPNNSSNDQSTGHGLSPQNQIQSELLSKINKTSSFFFNVLERMITDEETRLQRQDQLMSVLKNSSFVYSIFALCLQTFCYVREIKGIGLDALLIRCKITSFDLWRTISSFAKFDRAMPESIKESLFNLEKAILLYNVWEDGDCMETALTHFKEESSDMQNYERVASRRLISHSATRVKEICKVLELSEIVQESVWDSLLYVFRCQTQLLRKRYVDQIIICSIYALRLIRADLFKGKEMKFRNIITGCEKLIDFNSKKVKKVSAGSATTASEQPEESIDIIGFYNKIFLIPMRAYYKQAGQAALQAAAAAAAALGNGTLLSTPSSSNESIRPPPSPSTQHSIFSTSLNDSIPSNFLQYTPILKDAQVARGLMTPMTPMTSRLQAIGESFESPNVAAGQNSLRFRENHLKAAAIQTGKANSLFGQIQSQRAGTTTATFNSTPGRSISATGAISATGVNSTGRSAEKEILRSGGSGSSSKRETPSSVKQGLTDRFQVRVIPPEEVQNGHNGSAIEEEGLQQQGNITTTGADAQNNNSNSPPPPPTANQHDEEDSRSKSQMLDLFGHQVQIASGTKSNNSQKQHSFNNSLQKSNSQQQQQQSQQQQRPAFNHNHPAFAITNPNFNSEDESESDDESSNKKETK